MRTYNVGSKAALTLALATFSMAGCAKGEGARLSTVEVNSFGLPAGVAERTWVPGTFVRSDGGVVETSCAESLRTKEDGPSNLDAWDGTTMRSDGALVVRDWVAEGTNKLAYHPTVRRTDAWVNACCAAYGCGDFFVQSTQSARVNEVLLAGARSVRISKGERSALLASIERAQIAALRGEGTGFSASVRAKIDPAHGAEEPNSHTIVIPTFRRVPARDPVFANHVHWVEQNVWADAPVIRIATVMEDLSFSMEGQAPVDARFVGALGASGADGLSSGWELTFESLPPLGWRTLVVQSSRGERLELPIRVGGDRPFVVMASAVGGSSPSELPAGSQGIADKIQLRTPMGTYSLPFGEEYLGNIHVACRRGEACGSRQDQVCVSLPGTPLCLVSHDLPLRAMDASSGSCVRVPNTDYCLEIEQAVRFVVSRIDAQSGQLQMLRGVLESMLRNYSR